MNDPSTTLSYADSYLFVICNSPMKVLV